MNRPPRRFFFHIVFPLSLFLLFFAWPLPVFAGGRQEGGAGAPAGEAASREEPSGGGRPSDTGSPPSGEEPGLDAAPAPESPAGTAGDSGETPPLTPGSVPEAGEEAALDGGEFGEAEGEKPVEISPEDKLLELDIRTSSLMELAAWCRSLGISEGGTREDLISRLRTHFNLVPPVGGEVEGKIITIESARTTEYFTLDVVDEEYARLRGDVVVSLKDGEAIHRIRAWDILYNRTRNILTASGGVEYIKTEGDTIETFRGNSITVNLDNWASVFTDGLSERSLSDNQTSYRFAGTIISRNDEAVTVITRATIGNAKNEEAYWTLHASKLWLLPGSDWAILNAVLKVGEIPLLYIPAFFFPADEIIFHPVVGYRSREGNFVQTTTYILGRPKSSASSESSITKILGNSADMEKVREGIFLRSTGKKSRDPNTTRFSVIFDTYANLGTYLGTELALPPKAPFGTFDLSAGVGFTRDVVKMDTGYTPFPRYDGTSDWNYSRLFDNETPFRYRLNTKGSFSGKYGSVNLAFPFYSDPYVDKDFLNRSEELDWFSMLREGASRKEEETTTTTTDTSLGAYEWRLNGSLNPPVSALAPYISTLSLSSLTSTVSFRTRESDSLKTTTHSPNRKFFFPDKFTMYSFSLSLAGTPLTLGGGGVSQNSAMSQNTSPSQPEAEDPLKNIGIPRSPFGPPEDSTTKPGTALSTIPQLVPPALTQRFDGPRQGGPQFSIDYRLNPSSASELQFNSAQGTTTFPHWRELEDVDWGDVASILTNFRGDASTGFNLTHANGGAYTFSFRFSGTGSWQDYTYINEEAQEFLDSTGNPDQNRINEARRRAYSATYFTTSWEHTTTLKPLYLSTIWGNSSLQYTVKGLLVSNKFDTNSTGADPLWEMEYGKWDKDNLDTHQVTANINASVMDKMQNLTITADLPPEDATLSGNATIRAWFSETNARGKILFPWEEVDRKVEPFYITETLRWSSKGSVQQYIVYDPELEEYTNLTSSLTWAGLTASLTSVRSKTYDFDLDLGGWIQSMDPESLNLRDLRIAYTGTFKKESLWNKRLTFSLNLNTSLNFDLQRYTYSRFTFSLAMTLGINRFLDLTFSATSENAVIFRYFQNMPLFTTSVSAPVGETNLFIDLLNSFRFDQDDLRRSSGFKMKSFNLNMTHHLGDWNAKLGVTLSPYLDQNTWPYQYKFNNEISFVVQWIPISEIKTQIDYNKEKIIFK